MKQLNYLHSKLIDFKIQKKFTKELELHISKVKLWRLTYDEIVDLHFLNQTMIKHAAQIVYPGKKDHQDMI